MIDGRADEASSSTYCSVLAGPVALDSPSLSVTTTGVAPDPSWGFGELGGTPPAADGNCAVIEVSLLTVNLDGRIAWSPTVIPSTSGVEPFSNPDPAIVTVPPAMDSVEGVRPLTAGRVALWARLHREAAIKMQQGTVAGDSPEAATGERRRPGISLAYFFLCFLCFGFFAFPHGLPIFNDRASLLPD